MKKAWVLPLTLLLALALGLASCGPEEGEQPSESPSPGSEVTLTLDRAEAEVEAGRTVTLTATVTPTGTKVAWETDNAGVATVAEGVVTGVAAGTAKITARAGTASASCTVTVTQADTRELTLSSAGLRLGYYDGPEAEHFDSNTLTAFLNGEAAADVTWESSAPGVAEVLNGVVTAVGAGSCVITAKKDGLAASCAVEVKEYVPVQTVQDFLNIGAEESEYAAMGGMYLLTSNINFEGAKFYPLGYVDGKTAAPFTGVLNGNGHALLNVEVLKSPKAGAAENTPLYNGGIFREIGAKGVVKNLTVDNLTMSVGTSCGVFGDVNNGRIENVFVHATLTGAYDVSPTNNTGSLFGGLVFRNGRSGIIENSVVLERLAGKGSPRALAYHNDGNIVNTYVFTDAEKLSESGAERIVGGGKKAYQELLSASLYAAFDSGVWTVADGKLPYLTNSPDPNEADVTITLSETEVEVEKNASVTISATVSPLWLAPEWKSSDVTVATVENGEITGVAEGEATVTAKAGTVEKHCTVRVTEPKLVMNRSAVRLGVLAEQNVFDSEQVAALNEGLTETVAFSSDNTGIATVDADGVITAVSAGTCTVTATAGKFTGTVAVTVLTYTPVSTVAEFKAIGAKDAEKHAAGMAEDKAYLLTGNIDFTGVTDLYTFGVTSGLETAAQPFEGILNGNGHALIDLAVKRSPDTGSANPDSGQYGGGLFVIIGQKGVVRNLTLANFSINAAQTSGTLASVNNGLIENVAVKAALKGTTSATEKRNGGLVYRNAGTIRNCVVDFTMSGVGSGYGLAYVNQAAGVLQNCYATVSGIAESTAPWAEQSGKAENCALKTADELKNADLFAGWSAVWKVENDKLPYLKNSPDPNVTVPALVLNQTSLALACAPSADVFDAAALTAQSEGNVAWRSADETVARVDANGVVTAVAPGNAVIYATDGTAEGKCGVTVSEYVLIATPQQFLAIGENGDHSANLAGLAAGKAYLLMQDIDFAGITVYPLGVTGKVTAEAGYTAFNGLLNGNGYALKNIALKNHPNSDGSGSADPEKNLSYSGIFMAIGPNGIVRNLAITGFTLKNETTNGTLAYTVNGLVENVSIEATVDTTGGTAGQAGRFGGIAGRTNAAGAVIRNCLVRLNKLGTVGDAKSPSLLVNAINKGKVENCVGISLAISALVRGGAPANCVRVVDETAAVAEAIFTALYSKWDADAWNIVSGTLPTLKHKQA